MSQNTFCRLWWMCHLTVCLLIAGYTAHAQEKAPPQWILETNDAGWQARDSQGEVVFGNRLWIMGGWFSSFEAPPRDVWSSTNGRDWTRVTNGAPWLHSDLSMAITFDDRMWMMGGWYNGRLPGHSASNQVWWSTDGAHWRQATANASWSPRIAAALVESQERMWILGGTEDYYFGDDRSLRNDVWSSADGANWRQETAAAGWSPRAYHQAAVLNGRIYVFAGGNYVPTYHVRNDVWSSDDGVHWTCETESAPWDPRIWFSTAVYRGRIWVLGGWSKEHDNFDDAWHSKDGKTWKRLQTPTCWKSRHEHSAFVLNDKLWIAGGHARPLSSEVWSLHLPDDWDE